MRRIRCEDPEETAAHTAKGARIVSPGLSVQVKGAKGPVGGCLAAKKPANSAAEWQLLRP